MTLYSLLLHVIHLNIDLNVVTPNKSVTRSHKCYLLNIRAQMNWLWFASGFPHFSCTLNTILELSTPSKVPLSSPVHSRPSTSDKRKEKAGERAEPINGQKDTADYIINMNAQCCLQIGNVSQFQGCQCFFNHLSHSIFQRDCEQSQQPYSTEPRPSSQPWWEMTAAGRPGRGLHSAEDSDSSPWRCPSLSPHAPSLRSSCESPARQFSIELTRCLILWSASCHPPLLPRPLPPPTPSCGGKMETLCLLIELQVFRLLRSKTMPHLVCFPTFSPSLWRKRLSTTIRQSRSSHKKKL